MLLALAIITLAQVVMQEPIYSALAVCQIVLMSAISRTISQTLATLVIQVVKFVLQMQLTVYLANLQLSLTIDSV